MSRDCKSTKKYLNSTKNSAVFWDDWLLIRKFYIHLHRKKKSMKEKLRFLAPAILVLGLLVTAYCLLAYEGDFLWKAQELNLFLDTPLFLRQQMVSSGWLISWLGAYFTEFFYHQAVGVGILIVWWAVLMLLIGRTFKVPMKWAVVLLIPIAALLLTIVDLGYWLYYLKLKGHFFVATIGTTLAVLSVWGGRLVPPRYFLRPIYVVVITALLYPLAGFYGLLAALLMGILVWRLKDMTTKDRIVTSAAALLAIGFCPLVYYHFVFYQTNMVNILWTGLPLFVINEDTPAYYIPYYILVASLVAMALMYKTDWEKTIKRPWVWVACQVLIAGAVVYGVQRFWYKDYNFHKELRMQRLLEDQDWNGILSEAAYAPDEPTRAIVMMKNLALFRLGRQGDEMYHYKTGAKASDTPLPINMSQIVGRSIYYNYGLLNYCYRWCLEDGVELGWRIEYLKYLTRCALLNGENRVAQKYIDLLKHTRYYREWAEHYEKFIGNEKALRAETEFQQIFHLMTSEDVLSSDNALVEKFLMNQFVYTQSKDTLFQEQAVISALWMKDIQIFWPIFFEYAASHIGQHMPIHFQEAAYLYGHLEKAVDISKMPFDESVVKSYDEFMAMAQRCAGMSEAQMRDVFYPQFGKTFYYEYFLIRNQKLY